VEDRCALLRLLCSLCAESTRLHNKLMGEEDEVGGAAGSATPPARPLRGCSACCCWVAIATFLLARRYCRRWPGHPLPHATDSRPLSLCHPALQLRDKKKEIASLKQEVKRRQAELTQQQQQQQQQQLQQQPPPPAEGQAGQAAAVPLLPQQRSRRGDRDLAAEIERLVEKISGLEHDIIQVHTQPQCILGAAHSAALINSLANSPSSFDRPVLYAQPCPASRLPAGWPRAVGAGGA
jgi:hypothetical protein